MTVIEHLNLTWNIMRTLIHVDYCENYQCQQQNEIQSAYFGHKSVSLLTERACFRSINYNEVKSFLIDVTTEALDRSRVASLSCINKIFLHVESLIGNVVKNAHIFSDGMSSQFRSRFVFHFLTKTLLEKNTAWHYDGPRHGKSPMDGIGGTMKNLVFKKVKSGHCIIDTA